MYVYCFVWGNYTDRLEKKKDIKDWLLGYQQRKESFSFSIIYGQVKDKKSALSLGDDFQNSVLVYNQQILNISRSNRI